MSSENGTAGVPQTVNTDGKLDTLVITYDRVKDALNVGGEVHSLDLMLDMLARATRTVESEWRKSKALELQAALKQQAENAAIAAAIRTGR